MPIVRFLPSGVVAEFELHRLPYKKHGRPGSILDVALNFGVPLEHTCGGNCSCTACHVIIRKGQEHLSEIDDYEDDRLSMAEGLTLHSRLGCQAVVRGDVTVEIPKR